MRWWLALAVACDGFYGLEPLDNVVDHDEDKDGTRDRDDPCPAIAANGGDQDMDGVGDACDPHPTVTGDHILAADYFEIAPTFFAPAGTWQLGGDAITTTGDPASTSATLTFTAPATAPAIELGFKPIAYPSGLGSGAVEISVELDFPGGKGGCSIHNDANPMLPVEQQDALKVIVARDNNRFPVSEIPPAPVDTPITMRIVRDANGVVCTVNGASPDMVTDETHGNGILSATITVTAFTAEIDYAIVYDSP